MDLSLDGDPEYKELSADKRFVLREGSGTGLSP